MGTVKYTGPVASFHCPTNAEIRSLKVHFSPKQLGSGDPSPENVREISGWKEVEVYKTGKNIFDVSNAVIVNGKIRNDNGTIIGDSAAYTSSYIAVIPNTTYTITIGDYSNSTYNGGRRRVYFLDQEYNWISRTEGYYYQTDTFITPSNCYYIQLQCGRLNSNNYSDNWNAIQVELGSTSTAYEPYTGTTLPIDWTTEAGTIYGGYVDLITGEVQQTYDMIILDGTAPFNNIVTINEDTNLLRFRMYLNEVTNKTIKNVSNPNLGYFNYLKSEPVTTDAWNGYFTGGSANPRLTVYVQDDTITSIDSFLNYLNIHPLQVCYELETPIIHQLTPQQLQTFLGHNNVWSNADYVEVEYDLHETQDILARKNFIIASQPHIETASGDIVSFNTDVSAPLKECKIHFSPVQEGSGDPSPSNVRAIYGWESVKYANLINQDILNISASETETYGLTITKNDTYPQHVTIKGTNTIDQSCLVIRTKDTAIANTQYYIYNIPHLGSGDPWRVGEGNKLSALSQSNNTFTASFLNGHSITANGTGQIRIYLRAQVNKTYDLDFYPIISTIAPTQINWQSDYGTIYGGYVDLVNGEVVENYAIITVDSQKDWLMRSINGHGAASLNVSDFNSGMIKADTISIFNYAKYIAGSSEIADWTARIANNGLITIFVSSEINTRDDMNNYITQHPLQICYKLATPIHHSLTPQTLRTLRGQNNIWSNANGNIEIQYWRR